MARNKALKQSQIVEKAGYSKECYVKEQTIGELEFQSIECVRIVR